jgi:predicted alpha/beta superfamily hydrolase
MRKGEKYPVLYLLDGPAHFYSVVGMIKQLSTTNGNTVLPEMIVVAIPNTNRDRDLTPTKVEIDFFTGDSSKYESGGGDLFLDFIEKELVPYIDKTYSTSTYRTLIGHSYGGLSVINALTTKQHLFNNFVAIDPSLWWDDMAYLKNIDSLLSAGNYASKGLYVGIANTMDEGMDIDNVVKDTTKYSTHIRSILKFVKSQDLKNNGLRFDWKYYEDDSHGSVPLITEYDALRFLFSWYEFKGINSLYEASITIEESLELLRSHYDNVSKNMGYKISPNEALINSLGYFYISEQKLERAAAFFDLNIKNYPNSNNVYDSRGDCYLVEGDSLAALTSFKRALAIGKNGYTQEKIDKLSTSMKE